MRKEQGKNPASNLLICKKETQPSLTQMFILQLFTVRHDRATGNTNSVHTPLWTNSISGLFARLRTNTAKENGAAVLDKLTKEIWAGLFKARLR